GRGAGGEGGRARGAWEKQQAMPTRHPPREEGRMLMLESGFVRGRKDAGLLPVRAALGASMMYHGLGKLKEESRDQAGQMFEQVGLRPGKALAIATGTAEVFAGACALLGFLTRPAALAVLVTQAVAIAKVHAKNGFDITT